MDRIPYKEHIRSHNPKSIYYWTIEGILIDGKRWMIQEFRDKEDGLYVVISDENYNKRVRYYEHKLVNKLSDEFIQELKDSLVKLKKLREDHDNLKSDVDSRFVEINKKLESYGDKLSDLEDQLANIVIPVYNGDGKVVKVSVVDENNRLITVDGKALIKEQLNDNLTKYVNVDEEDLSNNGRIKFSEKFKNKLETIEQDILRIDGKDDKDTKYKSGDGLTLSDTVFSVDKTSNIYGENPKSLEEMSNSIDAINGSIEELESREDKDTKYSAGVGLNLEETTFNIDPTVGFIGDSQKSLEDILNMASEADNDTKYTIRDGRLVGDDGSSIEIPETVYTGNGEVSVSEDNVISVDLSRLASKSELDQVKTVADNAIEQSVSTEQRLINFIANHVDNDTIYDDTEIKKRITSLEERPDNDTRYTAGSNVSISQDNRISVDFSSLATKQEISEIIAEVPTEIGTTNLALNTYLSSQDNSRYARVRYPINFERLKPLEGKVITVSFEARSTIPGPGTVFLLDLGNYQSEGMYTNSVGTPSIGTDWTKISVQMNLRPGLNVTDGSMFTLAHDASESHVVEIKPKTLKVEASGIKSSWSLAPEDTMYTAGTGLSLTGNQFKNTGQIAKLTQDNGLSITLTDKDLNNLTSGGNYQGNNLINAPETTNHGFYIQVEGHNNLYTKQTATNFSSGDTYVRTKNNGNWGEWKRLDNTTEKKLTLHNSVWRPFNTNLYEHVINENSTLYGIKVSPDTYTNDPDITADSEDISGVYSINSDTTTFLNSCYTTIKVNTIDIKINDGSKTKTKRYTNYGIKCEGFSRSHEKYYFSGTLNIRDISIHSYGSSILKDNKLYVKFIIIVDFTYTNPLDSSRVPHRVILNRSHIESEEPFGVEIYNGSTKVGYVEIKLSNIVVDVLTEREIYRLT